MRVNDTISQAMAGLQRGVDKAERAASEVVRNTADHDAVVRKTIAPLLELKEAEREVAINARVIKTADETLGTIIDERV